MLGQPEPAKTPYVFVSYARADTDTALEIVRSLETAGVQVWLDQRKILPGAMYGTAIAEAIENCTSMVVVCTTAALHSRNVRQEIGLAWKYKRPYIPLMLEELTLPRDVEYWLEGAQWVEVMDHADDVWLPSVLTALRYYSTQGELDATPDPDQTAPALSPAGARYALRWTGADGAPGELALREGTFTIGRSPECAIELPGSQVSRMHARVVVRGTGLAIEDLGSTNGTLVNGDRVQTADLGLGDQIDVGRTSLRVETANQAQGLTDAPTPGVVELPTEVIFAEPVSRAERGIVPAQLLERPIISEAELMAVGVEIQVSEYAALGAGLGSFAWVDMLRNSGVPASEVSVIGNEEQPYGRYARLCRNSQISLRERLRSPSEACPDNLWGFPGYAVREAWSEAVQGHLQTAGGILWRIFGESAIAPTYAPRSGDVLRALDRESERIGWSGMRRRGRIRAIRKSAEGRLLAIISDSDEVRRKHFVVSSRFLHLATGYPAIQLLPDLAAYRENHKDERSVVNAFENHDHVYEHLARHGGTVLMRGRGIVASRVLQRLWEERQNNKNITVVHLHRARLSRGHHFGLSRRAVEEQWELQAYDWPKSCWGGEQLQMMRRASDPERKRALDAWGGTTTANRSNWRRIIREGIREGWYRPEFGRVDGVEPSGDGGTVTQISSVLSGGGTLHLRAEFVIDCTGALHDHMRSPLWADLIRMYQLPLNGLDHLQVSDDFEVPGMRHRDARLYAAGGLAHGGPHPAVDSFLGLQYAALKAVDSIQQLKPPRLRRLDGLYSARQWSKWARGVEP